MWCKRGIISAVLWGFCFYGALHAEVLPPVGERFYFIKAGQPAVPASIEARDLGKVPSGTIRMRDPIPFGSLEKKMISPLRAALAPKKISRMTFERALVDGRYMVPRVRFDRAPLNIPEAEEPITVDYRKKIKESERLIRELEW